MYQVCEARAALRRMPAYQDAFSQHLISTRVTDDDTLIELAPRVGFAKLRTEKLYPAGKKVSIKELAKEGGPQNGNTVFWQTTVNIYQDRSISTILNRRTLLIFRLDDNHFFILSHHFENQDKPAKPASLTMAVSEWQKDRTRMLVSASYHQVNVNGQTILQPWKAELSSPVPGQEDFATNWTGIWFYTKDGNPQNHPADYFIQQIVNNRWSQPLDGFFGKYRDWGEHSANLLSVAFTKDAFSVSRRILDPHGNAQESHALFPRDIPVMDLEKFLRARWTRYTAMPAHLRALFIPDQVKAGLAIPMQRA